MKTELIHSLTSAFEAHAQQTDGGTGYWLAHDLQHLLGYTEWRNFNSTAASGTRIGCEVAGHEVSGHFVDLNKMVAAHRYRRARKPRVVATLSCVAAPKMNDEGIDASVITKYRQRHIRPLAVRPLNYPEREPTPWGFLFCASRARVCRPIAEFYA